MIRIEPLTFEHIRILQDPENEPGLLEVMSPGYWDAIINSGTAFAGYSDGVFLGIAGYAQPWPGVASLFSWAAPGARKRPKDFHKACKRAVKHLEDDKGCWRLSCEVRAGNEQGVRWVEKLGFKYECTMRKWGPDGSNFMLFSKVRG